MTNEQQTIIKAIEADNFPYIKNLVNNHPTCLAAPLIDETEGQGLAIHYAAMHGRFNIARLLLEKNPSLLNQTTSFNYTPLRYAAARGHEQLVDYLISLGALQTIATHNPEQPGHGFYPIHWAAVRGHHRVVQCLLTHAPNIDTPLSYMNLRLIHLASMNGRLEVVKLLLDKNPNLLNEVDMLNQTPLLWAAAQGHVDVVNYLLSKNANCEMATRDPFEIEPDRTPLMWAMNNKYYETANALIIKKCETEKIETLMYLVETGEQALDLMALKPAFIPIFLRDKTITDAIKKSPCKIIDDSIHWYKSAGRRPSFFANINTTTNTSTVFKPVQELGRGSYGIVRLFRSSEGQELGVKSLKNPITNTPWFGQDQLGLNIKREAQFNQIAYPNDPLSEIHEFHRNTNGHSHYTNRFIMAYIKGDTAKPALMKVTSPHLLAHISLKIAQELERIHQLGIIHGDLYHSNIMIHCDDNKNVAVRLIDFGLASYLTDRTVKIFQDQTAWWIAPERCNGNRRLIKPNPNQDVYSLGRTFHHIFEHHPSKKQLMELFPAIRSFISTSQEIIPTERPSLALLCEQLMNELRQKPNQGNFWQKLKHEANAFIHSLQKNKI